MTRIAVIIPVLAMSDEAIEGRISVLRKYAHLDTEFAVYKSKSGPPAIESRCDRQLAGNEVMRLACKAERDGCDAAMIWCAGDPAIGGARELVNIPVIGTGEAGMLYAYTLAQNFCVLTGDEDLAATSYEVAVRTGLMTKMVSIRGIHMSVAELRADREKALEGLTKVAKEAIERGWGPCVCLWLPSINRYGRRISKKDCRCRSLILELRRLNLRNRSLECE